MKNLRKRSLGFLALAIVGLAAASAVASQASVPVTTSTISAYDVAMLGLDLRPLDASSVASVAAGDTVSEAAARATVAERFGFESSETEALHVMARVTADSPLVPVWLMLYKGGTIDLPMGPVGDVDWAKPLTPAYTGVMLDDSTGEVLLVFAGGSQ